jgi:hypothetical protein
VYFVVVAWLKSGDLGLWIRSIYSLMELGQFYMFSSQSQIIFISIATIPPSEWKDQSILAIFSSILDHFWSFNGG